MSFRITLTNVIRIVHGRGRLMLLLLLVLLILLGVHLVVQVDGPLRKLALCHTSNELLHIETIATEHSPRAFCSRVTVGFCTLGSFGMFSVNFRSSEWLMLVDACSRLWAGTKSNGGTT